ncbi:MAG TPA: endonuclease/exonuclease/phosphatase family protein [Allosphingosinicella sp.]|nr:endonuclease/exonuclease/phosphatase family protein [Allosphingosinicella sp.]
MRPLGAAVLASLLLGGCVALPKPRSIACADARKPAISVSEDGRTAFTHLDVLTYNIEGLPSRLRTGRGAAQREIGERLAALRESGRAPDVVMFQEVFSRPARRAVLASGYPSLAPGPAHNDRPPPALRRSLPGKPNPGKGEVGIKLASSGIVIATEYPVVERLILPFARGSCAGFDCLSNKGVVFAEIAVPGVPGTIDLFNTHMNSMKASGVAERRHLAAHVKQVREITDFMVGVADPASPIILGGDFNMRNSEARFAEFSRLQPLDLVHRYCMELPDQCDVRVSWDGDEPWMDTQDLQLFWSGNPVKVRPVRVEAMFDGGEGGPRLSDHDGFRVLYELSWPVRGAPPPRCPLP